MAIGEVVCTRNGKLVGARFVGMSNCLAVGVILMAELVVSRLWEMGVSVSVVDLTTWVLMFRIVASILIIISGVGVWMAIVVAVSVGIVSVIGMTMIGSLRVLI